MKEYKQFILAAFIVLIGVNVSYSQSLPSLKPQKTKTFNGHQLYKQSKTQNNKEKKGTSSKLEKIADRAQDRIYYDIDRTCNPETRKIPSGIREREVQFVTVNKSLAFNSTLQKNSGSNWKSRGPFNVGGRTRALAIDLSNENVILAGGVSGGLWRSEDSGKSWRRVTQSFQNPSITSIAQDPRPGHQHVWYYGGGERAGLGDSQSAAEATFTGDGIYKSQDGGRTWELLPATADNTVTETSPFDQINKIVVNPKNGHVYAATWNGIHKSINGGTSFKEVLATGENIHTEIEVTSGGKFYAFVGRSLFNNNVKPFKGIYTSFNGNNWENISAPEEVFDEDSSARAVIAINPSNENELYILADQIFLGTPGLYRYNDKRIKKWKDLSDKLPETGTRVQGLNVQSGYNMVIKVHPKNPKVIFVGGTNLFRTTDGFRTQITSEQNSWIGGYAPVNDISVYQDHHPDQHELIFFPSNPNMALSACDGGVFITKNILANRSFEEPVDWISLNNGYLTTQPYAVSITPNEKREDIMAGFQDNGTWLTNTSASNATWIEQFSGDGSYNAFADDGRTRYVSSQLGNIFRLNLDQDGNFVSFASVTPLSLGGFSFVNPFILDPNNDNIMYLPVGNGVYRNSNLDELPTGTTQRTDFNWNFIAEVPSILDNNNRELNTITALDISRFPQPDRLYYGTGQGQLYRIDHVSLAGSEPVNIFEGKGLPENAYVSSIHVDPSNDKRVVVAFSNYEVRSVFFTNNAGKTWVDISGNLEENRDGSGNGPSVRWVSFIGNKNGLLAGTSTGVYYTDRLQSKHTVWRQENRQLGNSVVEQVRTRKDGFTAIGVHGNGTYSKKFNVKPQEELTLELVNPIANKGYTTEKRKALIDLSNVFKESGGNDINISVTNSNKDLLKVTLRGNSLLLGFKKSATQIPEWEKEGTSSIRIFAEYNGQKIATNFFVTVSQTPFFQQFEEDLPVEIGGAPSMIGEDVFSDSGLYFAQMADDINIPDGEKWVIQRIVTPGQRIFPSINGDPNGDLVYLKIYEDDNGVPGELIYNREDLDIRSQPEVGGQGILDFLTPDLELDQGRYWIAIGSIDDYLFNNNWAPYPQIVPNSEEAREFPALYWQKTDLPIVVGDGGNEEWLPMNMLNIFGGSVSEPIEPMQLVFNLYGNNANSTKAKLAEKKNLNDLFSIHPNPSKDNFNFSFYGNTGLKAIRIYDVTGKEVLNKQLNQKSDNYVWSSKGLTSGIYIVKVTGDTINETLKIIKE